MPVFSYNTNITFISILHAKYLLIGNYLIVCSHSTLIIPFIKVKSWLHSNNIDSSLIFLIMVTKQHSTMYHCFKTLPNITITSQLQLGLCGFLGAFISCLIIKQQSNHFFRSKCAVKVLEAEVVVHCHFICGTSYLKSGKITMTFYIRTILRFSFN